MLLKLWLRRLRFDDPGLLEAPLPAAGTLEGPGNLQGPDKHSSGVLRHVGYIFIFSGRIENGEQNMQNMTI